MEETAEYIRQLECHELEHRHQADARLAPYANTDDPEELDALCVKVGTLWQQRDTEAAMVLWEELIVDLTICLGDILLRYLLGNWIIQGLQVAEDEPTCESWVLMLHAEEAHFSLNVEAYVTARFYGQNDQTFGEFVESCICRLQHIPGAYLGGYGPMSHDH